MQNSSFCQKIESFISHHKVACALSLGIAIVGYAIGYFGGRLIRHLCHPPHETTPQRVDNVAQTSISTPSQTSAPRPESTHKMPKVKNRTRRTVEIQKAPNTLGPSYHVRIDGRGIRSYGAAEPLHFDNTRSFEFTEKQHYVTITIRDNHGLSKIHVDLRHTYQEKDFLVVKAPGPMTQEAAENTLDCDPESFESYNAFFTEEGVALVGKIQETQKNVLWWAIPGVPYKSVKNLEYKDGPEDSKEVSGQSDYGPVHVKIKDDTFEINGQAATRILLQPQQRNLMLDFWAIVFPNKTHGN